MWQQPDYTRYKEKLNGEGWASGQARRDVPPDQDRRSNTTRSVRFGELVALISTTWAACQAAADAHTPRHRNADHSA